MLLVIDTCTERMLVGAVDGARERWINNDAQGNHARDLLPAVRSVLGNVVPDAVAVALGPGSFTGVRIGLATAKGLSEGWNVPLLGLDNLEAMADAWRRLVPRSEAAVFPVIDARKQKFYAALYGPMGEILAPGDRSPIEWMAAVQREWRGPVVVSGYQGRVFAEAAETLPDRWSVLETRDWTPGLLDQALREWKAQRFLGPDAGPRYLRLSEAEENLRARTSDVRAPL